ncbi:hypothetical protein HanRHA438_Chr17g0821021 [Helianthus annuus]|nr:hypothetical protein HanRHA438_Chr17g0821021 [Helianthus annuus]
MRRNEGVQIEIGIWREEEVNEGGPLFFIFFIVQGNLVISHTFN